MTLIAMADYDYIMAPQRGRPYGANLGSMGRNTGTWSIRSDCPQQYHLLVQKKRYQKYDLAIHPRIMTNQRIIVLTFLRPPKFHAFINKLWKLGSWSGP